LLEWKKVGAIAEVEGMLFSHERWSKFKIHLYEWFKDDKRLASIVHGH
jgi:hypothetical protein